MNRTLIELILKISDTKSFTRAGQELNMTQPAVSRAVATLEAELGVKLLTRNRRQGVLLTDVGERTVRIFREILQGYEKIDQEIAREKGLEVGTVRIGAIPVAAASFLPKIIAHIAKIHPNIQFSIMEGTNAQIKDGLDSRQIDVGLIIAGDPKYTVFPLYREPMYAVFRDDNPLASKKEIRATDLLDRPMIICKAGYEPPVFEWFEQTGNKPSIKYVINHYKTALNMIQEGLGTAIMSELSLTDLPDGVVTRALHPPGYRDIHIAVPYYEDSSKAVRLFMETAQALFGTTVTKESNDD
ncbi:LysR family transcriptional regulator [Paenibacillus sp. SAF-054]|uniref:LysR family transcriptional regulator n=1 Tax=unclassified Paenibacillus TaxID=185978 RepID=UPI003F7CE9BE